jgi:gliding motility-associated-like protein
MKTLYQLLLMVIVLVCTQPNTAKASHVSGGDISYQCLGNDDFLVTLNLFRDCSGITLGTTATMTFSSTCGQNFTQVLNIVPDPITGNNQTNISQLCAADSLNSTCFNGNLPGMEKYTYQGIVTMTPQCDTWTMSWGVCCRNTTVNVNGQPAPYFEATMNSQTNPCNNSPAFTAQPIPYVCINQPVSYNYGVVETDGHVLQYSLVSARSAALTPVTYNGGYTAALPIPGIAINAVSGLLTFTPTVLGNFIVVVQVDEYDAGGNLLGTTMRDIQFVVQNCTNIVPDPPANGLTNLTGQGTQLGPGHIEVCEGDQFCFDVVFTDTDAANILTFSSNVNLVLPGATVNVAGTNPLTASICWTAQPNMPAVNVINLSVSDDACPVSGFNNFPVQIDIISSTWAGPDQTICLGQGAQLTASGGSVFNWTMLTGDPIVVPTNFSCNPCPNPNANPAFTTTYEVTSNLSGGCVNKDTVTINVVPDFTYLVTQSSAATCLQDTIYLDATASPAGNYTYTWSPATFLSATNIPNPSVYITTPGSYTYYIDIMSPGGCVKSDSVTISIGSGIMPDATAILLNDSIWCGDTAFLVGFVDTTQTSAGINDDFNNGINGSMWSSTNNGLDNIDCGSMTGNALHFSGTTGNREAATVAFNAAPCSTIDFCLFIGNSGSGGAPCENADTNEDVELQYSINGGGTWVSIQVYNQANWDTNNAWQCFSVPMPGPAQTGNTMLRWIQPQYSACTGCDNWALDDVSIQCSTLGNYVYSWSPSNVFVDATLQNPAATPPSTMSVTFTVTDTVGGCSDSASVNITVLCGTCFPATPTVTNVTCFGGSDGSIFATPNGFNGPFTFTYTDSTSGQVLQVTNNVTVSDQLSGLPAGTYIITSTDTTGCFEDTIITITEPPLVTVTPVNDTIICIGGTASLSAAGGGGTPGYTFVWNQGLIGSGPHNVNPLTGTYYTVFAQDINGCPSALDSVNVSLYPPILVTTSGNDSVCPNGSIVLTAIAVGGDGGPYTYVWDDGTGTVGTGDQITVSPGNSSTNYCVTVTDGCETPPASECLTIDYYPLAFVDFVADVIDGCYPVDVTFTNNTAPGMVGSALWDFGDGFTATDILTASHSYGAAGCYDVNLQITTTNGCISDTTFTDYICAYDYPDADFLAGPQPTTILHPEITFTNQSSADAINYQWTFGNNGEIGFSGSENPVVLFPEDVPGSYNVELVVINQYGCTDTTNQIIVIDGEYFFYVPNAFTPDGDGINDIFIPVGEGVDVNDYSLQIFTRWGELVFETDDLSSGWDGSVKGVSGNTKSDVYVWKIMNKNRYDNSEKHEYIGHVTLLR